MTIYEKNYKLLKKLGIIQGDLSVKEGISTAAGYMDLHVESRVHLNGFKTGAIGLSLEHSYSQNGDTCSDPFMEILMYPEGSGPGMVEVYSFDVSIPPKHILVYKNSDTVDLSSKRSLNDFLHDWLINLSEQGHGKHWS
jgi:uncharacterized protein YqiB (DUF1249 family)